MRKFGLIPRTSIRWIVYGVVLGLALIGIRVADRPDGRAAAPPPPDQTMPRDASRVATDRVPELALERLAQREQRGTEGDPFNSLAAEEMRRAAVPPAPPPAPQAPPLPFSYLGKLVDGGKAVVFLASGDRNWAVRSGDTIDGSYRVDAIGDGTMTLTYLALDVRQELAIGVAAGQLQSVATSPMSAALPVAVSTPVVPGEARLLLAAPSRVAAGNELIVSLGLPPGGVVRDAQVDLAYDPRVLVPVSTPASTAGRVSVALAGSAGPLAQVRFKAIAQAPTETDIGIERIAATDLRGGSVKIAAPATHRVVIVQGSRAN
jgi:hypothetical protein